MMEFFKITFTIALGIGFLFIAWAFIRKKGAPISKTEGQLGNIGLKLFMLSLILAILVGGVKSCGKEKFNSGSEEHYLHTD